MWAQFTCLVCSLGLYSHLWKAYEKRERETHRAYLGMKEACEMEVSSHETTRTRLEAPAAPVSSCSGGKPPCVALFKRQLWLSLIMKKSSKSADHTQDPCDQHRSHTNFMEVEPCGMHGCPSAYGAPMQDCELQLRQARQEILNLRTLYQA